MPVAHAIAVVLFASLIPLPNVAGEGGRDRCTLSNRVAARADCVGQAIPAPDSDHQTHDAISPSPREEAEEWRECEDEELSDRADSPRTVLFPPCLPSDQVGSDAPGFPLTRLRARFLLCGRLDC
jgi:hypothetical protein